MYLTITNQDTLDTLTSNIVHREREVHLYQINIDNYNLMLASLPQGDVPVEIAQYVGNKQDNHTKMEDLPLSLSEEQVDLISKYQTRVNLVLVLRTEKVEQNKARGILESLKAQIPADKLETLVAEALVKVNAQSTPSA